MAELTNNLKNYSYYFEAYDAILHEFIGEYKKEIIEFEFNLENNIINLMNNWI